MVKSIEEQISGKCIHFNGVQYDTCRCGINYKTAFGKYPILRMPCLKNRMKHLKEDVIECDRLEFPTPESVKAEIEDQNNHIKLVVEGLSAVHKHIKTTGQKMGSIKCPNGDHDLTYSQAEVNGHIRMACKTCEISVME